MKKYKFSLLLFMITPLLYHTVLGQSDRFAYAVTALNKGGSEWVAFRKLDTRTAEFSSVLLSVQDKNQHEFDLSPLKVNPNKTASSPVINAQGNLVSQPVLGNSVAAIAYDRKTNRLYFTSMVVDQLRYIDLATMQVNSDLDQYFSKTGKYDAKFAGPVNRMVIAPDDFGYTITNDGNHLMRFNTVGSPVLTDLGELLDDPLNKEMVIHNNPCANSGGDLVADDAGQLFLITGSNRVFKVDINTKMTTYLATISGLPLKFTTSGAAVNEDGRIIISSSLYSDAVFIVDPETWNASSSPAAQEIYGSADLANSNFLHTKTASNLFLNRLLENNGKIKVYPNPVLFDDISVQFNQLLPGNYTIQLVNVLGKKVIQLKVKISGITQTEPMHIPHFAPQGFYYIHILDENNKVISTQKLVVERW